MIFNKGMISVLGLDDEKLEALLKEANKQLEELV